MRVSPFGPQVPTTLDIQIVSHGTPELVSQLLADLRGVRASVHVLENLVGVRHQVPPGVDLIAAPGGRCRSFAENHSILAERGEGDLIAILNPDLRVGADAFDELRAAFDDAQVGVVAPRVHSPRGGLEDNARQVLTPGRLLRDRMLPWRRRSDYPDAQQSCEPDWVAGMFMMVRRSLFEQLGGFDRRYRMYCEDMDFCVRAWLAGLRVRCVPSRSVVHDARRASLRNPRYLAWHVASLSRFWASDAYRRFAHGRGPSAAAQPAEGGR